MAMIRSYKINLYLKSSLFVLHRLKNYFILVRHFTFGIFNSSGQMRAVPREYLVGKRFLLLTNRSLRVRQKYVIPCQMFTHRNKGKSFEQKFYDKGGVPNLATKVQNDHFFSSKWLIANLEDTSPPPRTKILDFYFAY